VSGVPGIPGGLRRGSESEREEVSATRKRDLKAVPEVEEGRETKKRRIAPTPVTVGSVETNESAVMSTGENTPTS
jgi:chromatin assembly factor 1 subunit B